MMSSNPGEMSDKELCERLRDEAGPGGSNRASVAMRQAANRIETLERALASHLTGRTEALREAASLCHTKADELLAYRDRHCLGDGEAQQHAFTVADARYLQCRQLGSAIEATLAHEQPASGEQHD